MKVLLDNGAKLPVKAHDDDAGYDLFSPITITVPAKGSVVIDTGVHMEIPKGYAGMLKSKSGLNVKYGITSEGVIDCGYTGSIVVKLYNHDNKSYKVLTGDKITQIVIVPVLNEILELTDSLDKTERGTGGFGSSGR